MLTWWRKRRRLRLSDVEVMQLRTLIWPAAGAVSVRSSAFSTWRSLVGEQGLDQGAAADLMARLVAAS